MITYTKEYLARDDAGERRTDTRITNHESRITNHESRKEYLARDDAGERRKDKRDPPRPLVEGNRRERDFVPVEGVLDVRLELAHLRHVGRGFRV